MAASSVGRVLAVVVEALLPADVAHRGLGHHHPLETPGHVGAGLVGRTDLGHGQQVADRDHADQVPAVDDREVPVVVMGQAGPGRAHLLVGPSDVGVGGHPPADRLGRRVGAARPRPAAGRAR